MMQVSDFSSFLEVLAAIYTSMFMDDILKGIWSPKYYEDLRKTLEEYYLEGHEAFIDRIVASNQKKATSISMYMKNRATYLFVVCVLILLLSGFESGTQVSFNRMVFVNTYVIFLVICSVITLFFNSYSFSTKQHTAAVIILGVVVSGILSYCNLKWGWVTVSQDWVVWITLAFLILPIMWQVFVCWMFSSAYKGYIRSKLFKGKTNFELAKQGLEEHNPNKLPKRYKDLYSKISITSHNAEEAKSKCLDTYLELMEDEIAKASDLHSVLRIFGSWIGYKVTTVTISVADFLHIRADKTISQN